MTLWLEKNIRHFNKGNNSFDSKYHEGDCVVQLIVL